MIELSLDRDRFAPGDVVRGRVTVLHSGLQEIQVGLLFREEGNRLEQTVSQVLADGLDGAVDFEAGAIVDFEIELPADAPPNVESRHGALFWEIVAHTDRVGSPQTADRRIVVEKRSD